MSQQFMRGVCYLHCRDVLSREGIGSVADEQACFTHSPRIRKEGREDGQKKYNDENWKLGFCSLY